MAPHNCYPCTGADWISVAVADEAQWHQLCRTLDAGSLVDDQRYSTLTDRLAHTEILDLDVANFTRHHDAGELAGRLQAAGVPAAKSATTLDVISDPLLWDRELYRFVSDHREGQRPVLAAPWRMSAAPTEIARGAPDLGEHDDYVRNEILGSHAMERRPT
jgi:crotonobetainyl-CoA:carnitine CoA-transferase CaiB-like acyl-CoA transferase